MKKGKGRKGKEEKKRRKEKKENKRCGKRKKLLIQKTHHTQFLRAVETDFSAEHALIIKITMQSDNTSERNPIIRLLITASKLHKVCPLPSILMPLLLYTYAVAKIRRNETSLGMEIYIIYIKK